MDTSTPAAVMRARTCLAGSVNSGASSATGKGRFQHDVQPRDRRGHANERSENDICACFRIIGVGMELTGLDLSDQDAVGGRALSGCGGLALETKRAGMRARGRVKWARRASGTARASGSAAAYA